VKPDVKAKDCQLTIPGSVFNTPFQTFAYYTYVTENEHKALC